MASKTQKTEKIRHRKSAPNKVNRKTEQKRLRDSMEVLSKLEKENKQ